jgi:hypothetical protein
MPLGLHNIYECRPVDNDWHWNYNEGDIAAAEKPMRTQIIPRSRIPRGKDRAE